MKKFLFGLAALTIGAFAFISCDKNNDDLNNDEKKVNDPVLSYTQQQEILGQAVGSALKAANITELYKTIVGFRSEIGDSIDWNALIYALSSQNQELGYKINMLMSLLRLDGEYRDLSDMYFEAGVSFQEYEGALMPKIEYFKSESDMFRLDVFVNNDTISLDIMAHMDEVPRLFRLENGDTLKVNIPDFLEIELSKNSTPIVSLNADYTDSDFKVEYVEKDKKLSSLKIDGEKVNLTGKLFFGALTVDVQGNYTKDKGLSLKAVGNFGKNEALSVKANIYGTVRNSVDWVNYLSLMGWAIDSTAFKGVDLEASIYGGKVKMVTTLENPLKYPEIQSFLAGLISGQLKQTVIDNAINKINEIFKGEMYFEGFSKPQAWIRCEQAPNTTVANLVSVNIFGNFEDMIKQIKQNLDNTGIRLVIDTYDAQGNVITVKVKDYFDIFANQPDIKLMVSYFENYFKTLVNTIKQLREAEEPIQYEGLK